MTIRVTRHFPSGPAEAFTFAGIYAIHAMDWHIGIERKLRFTALRFDRLNGDFELDYVPEGGRLEIEAA